VSLFNQSTKAVSAVIAEIADSVGASADTEMLTRAFRSLAAAQEHFNNKANWEFTLTEAPPISVVGQFSIGDVTAASGVASATCNSGHGVLVDDVITFLGVRPGTRVTATAVSSFGFSTTIMSSFGTATAVVTASFVRDMYDLPSAWKAPYTVRLYGNNSTLRPYRRRFYDRSVSDEFTTSTPLGYDVFTIGGKGKIRLLPPPASSDTLQLRYYRRMTVASGVSDGTSLDIPQDYEPYLIAWAKWHFLMDKGEGRGEQGQTWLAFAEGGIKQMMSDQTRQPDEDLGFMPGQFQYNAARDLGDTRAIPWDY
jgi:hypothetical protein